MEQHAAAESLIRKIDARPFINGMYVDPATDNRIDVINPTTGKLLYEVSAGSQEDVNRAVAAARQAWPLWSAMPPLSRKAILYAFAEKIAENAKTLNLLDALEMGKPVSSPQFDALTASAELRFAAECIDKLFGEVVTSDPKSHVLKVRRSRGVIGAIVPWNFPTFNAVLKIAPALAAGNTVVLKPSEYASLSALKLAEIALEAGLPEGVLNIVPGEGHEAGRMLACHPGVDMVTFTGSTAVGQAIVGYSGQSGLKPVVLECGGKSPNIVFSDFGDLDAVSEAISLSAFSNSGQVCSAGTRLLVQRDIHDELLDKIVAHAKKMQPEDPLDPNARFGPLVSRKQMDRVLGYIQLGTEQGACLCTGGTQPETLADGNFVSPAVFSNVAPELKIAQEEVFGPVLSVIPFEDESDAVRIANSTVYGLTAMVWTSSLAVGHRLAEEIEAGGIFVNATVPTGDGPGLSFSVEPWKMSGFGVEFGTTGVETYTRLKTVMFNFG
jgi:acyl-CoA reductase-like NAD-dependent aldehyde dehydrogenase